MVRTYDFPLAVQRQLFVWSYHFLGWPAYDNRWLYPEIHDWDWSEIDEDYTIPAYIAFLVNPTLDLSFETKKNFGSHLRHMTEQPYELNWLRDPGIVWAIRRHIHYRYEYFYPKDFDVPKHEVVRRYSTIEWELQKQAWANEISMNGHKDGNNNDVLMVPRGESD